MPTNTYVQLYKETISGSSTSTVTFTSFTGYTDLRIVFDGQSISGSNVIAMRLNGTSGAYYSRCFLTGNGASPTGSRTSNATELSTCYIAQARANVTWDVMDYANTTKYKSILNRGIETAEVIQHFFAFRGVTGSSTEAITSITIFLLSGNFLAGSTFSVYGIRAEGVSPAAKATGGAIYSDSTYYYHAFGSTGVFTPSTSLTADILVVAGGGGGGGFTGGNGNGGGGAGGLLIYSSQSLSATAYTCTVGPGGAGGLTSTNSASGGTSQFGALTASVGGGRGASGGTAPNASAVGGSGGGGQGSNDLTFVNGSAGTSGQGNLGGNGYNSGVTPGGGGGGGAGGAGATGGAAIGGVGGIGATSSLINAIGAATGTGQLVSSNYYFAGGGGGSTSNSGSGTAVGGYGGGGTGYYDGGGAGTAGLTNMGGGGGAGRAANGGNGGSGIIVVRYLKV